ncbi:MAG TPA: 5-(carboxyamino)imidazole ribonucleotide synthase, partial [Thermoanaerobaculia bacterium]|nr:5-(carboxyamino)imidazole ribonucleotide synthase [Thermoanaerobaculia bacterium]
MTAPPPILPGSTIGVLGSGQLGRMLALAARRMGYRIHVFSPDRDSPAGQVADRETQSAYEDLDAVTAFARGVDVITLEFENVSYETIEAAARFVAVRPGASIIRISQNRIREKTFLRDAGLPTAPFTAVRANEDLPKAAETISGPAILKTASLGYDGKGQARIDRADQLPAAWERLAGKEAILEQFVDFEREVSVVAARGIDGSFAHWGVIENDHVNHILDISTSPAEVDDRVAAKAIELARAVLEKLDVIGVLCVEMFVTPRGEILINELAPRPHNSGHLTIEASVTSQFEQQARAVCGLSLGSTELLHPAAMANLLGDVWENGEPAWDRALTIPGVTLHLYGKKEPRPGRKMGHLTAVGSSRQEARAR